ncbi:MAG TPA: ABC transporter ATP-binding protein [Gammaproteobacteria bacterium]
MHRVVGQLLPFFRFYPWSLPLICLLGLLASLVEGIGLGLFIPFLENLAQDGGTDSGVWVFDALGALFSSVPQDRRLLVICLCIFLSIVAKAVLSFANKCLLHWLDAQIIHRLRSTIVDQLLTVDYPYLEKAQTGDLINTLGNETWRSSEALAEFVTFVTKACTIGVYGLLLVMISWELTLLVLIAMAFISMFSRWITGRAEALSREATSANRQATITEVEVVEGMKAIRTNSNEGPERRRFAAASSRAADAMRRVAMIREWVTPIYEVLAAGFLVFILYTSLDSGRPLAALLVFLFVLYRLQPLVRALDESRVHIMSLGGAVDAVTALINDTRVAAEHSGTKLFDGLKNEICFDRVSFRYNGNERSALKDVSMSLPAGRTIALVGHSGAGKTTLVNLIARLYDVESGNLTADDVPLRQLDLASWRKHMAFVSQETYLFNASVRDNIAYGRIEASDAEIVEAARDAEADGFIREFPEGYETFVGERGVRLSGGQRQRLALARAIVRKPDILILDEATNALDNISEQAIQKALQRIRVGRTVIIIAHRLTTITNAHLIVVLEKGRVVDQGTYRELIERQGDFAKLYRAELRQ